MNADIQLVEVDVRRNQDGALFLLHDPFLDRVSGVHRRLGELSTAECSRVRLLDGSPLARLEDMLDLVGDRTTLCLDLKEPACIPRLLPMLAASRARTQIWSSHAAAIQAASAASVPAVLISTGLNPRGIGDFLWRARNSGASGVSFFPADLEAHVIALCHHAGMPVQCGTPNDAATWKYLAARCVESIVTDRPLECAAFLAAPGVVPASGSHRVHRPIGRSDST
jgi:glycerophosphoryl diester phosphodiesterase